MIAISASQSEVIIKDAGRERSEKLKKRTSGRLQNQSDRLLGMLKERAVIIEDLREHSIWEIEKLITNSCRGKITEYDLWTEMDGLQEVKLYVRNLRRTIKDLLLHLGY